MNQMVMKHPPDRDLESLEERGSLQWSFDAQVR